MSWCDVTWRHAIVNCSSLTPILSTMLRTEIVWRRTWFLETSPVSCSRNYASFTVPRECISLTVLSLVYLSHCAVASLSLAVPSLSLAVAVLTKLSYQTHTVIAEPLVVQSNLFCLCFSNLIIVLYNSILYHFIPRTTIELPTDLQAGSELRRIWHRVEEENTRMDRPHPVHEEEGFHLHCIWLRPVSENVRP